MGLKNVYYRYRAYSFIIKKDLRDKFPLGLTRKLSMWRKGFLAEKFTLYQLDKNASDQFLSDYQSYMARWINEPFNEILTNKFIFTQIVGKHIRVPKIYGLFFNGIFYGEEGISLDHLIETHKQFVIKPISGGGGKYVFIVESIEKDTFIINTVKKLDQDGLVKLFEGLNNYLVCEYIEQGSFSKSLNPDTINSLRVLTLQDPLTKKPYIARAVQRIGVAKSKPMDNFTKGGLSAMIDLKTGCLSDSTGHPVDLKHIRHSIHPDSGQPIEGVIIPGWANIYDSIINLASSLPMLKCVGWDFIVTDEGIVPIEGNHHPDPDVLQGHGGLLNDSKVKHFYIYHNIITDT